MYPVCFTPPCQATNGVHSLSSVIHMAQVLGLDFPDSEILRAVVRRSVITALRDFSSSNAAARLAVGADRAEVCSRCSRSGELPGASGRGTAARVHTHCDSAQRNPWECSGAVAELETDAVILVNKAGPEHGLSGVAGPALCGWWGWGGCGAGDQGDV